MHGQVTAEFLILTGIGVLIATVMAAQASEQMELITALSAARTGASEAVSANTYAVYPATTFDEYSRGKPELLFPGKVRVMRIEVIDEGYSATYGRRKYRLRAWLSGPPLPSQLRESLSDRVNYCIRRSITGTFKTENLTNVFHNPAFSDNYVFTTSEAVWVPSA
ncbi:hypothetical protein [Methanothermobacter wolfeii]|uniref:hypothetical protein n=1 Tax=Methanothermobacter wolfeii TaxID=145261 RepID=UPI0024B35AF7|nr:hypothetical protein [Methanothermobacter wolfeii]MDI6701466.1 hypothetical protein [Methanothermobacter wolfeii]MDI6842608.1 hypothetical protein [Methanothermobacter wolfeii]